MAPQPAAAVSEHPCPAPGCGERVDNAGFACRADWRRLPPPIRAAIWRTYKARVAAAAAAASPQALQITRDAHQSAMLAGLAWFQANPAR